MQKYKIFIIPLFLLILASFLRLYKIEDYMIFLGDEGRDVLVVYNILHGDLTLLGPTSSVGGFFLGPIYYYFMVPFLWIFNYNPLGPAVMVAIFGIATVFLIYKIGKEFFSFHVGLIAALIYSISPLVVVYSRSSWNPNIMPFFSLLTLYILYKALNKNSRKLLILTGILLGITMQLHYLALFLGVVIAVYIFLSRLHLIKSVTFTTVIFKDYLATIIGFLIGWLPFLAFEIRHGFPNIISIYNFVFKSSETGGSIDFFKTTDNVLFRLFGRLITNFPQPETVAIFTRFDTTLWYYFTLLLGLASIFILILKWYEALKKDSLEFNKYNLLLIWLIVGIGLFGFYKKAIYDYYFGFMFPLPFFVVSIFLVALWKSSFGKVLSVIILLSILWLNYLGAPYKMSRNKQLEQAKIISKFVLDKTDNKPFNFALITGGNSDHAYRYFFRIWKKDPVVILNFNEDPKRKTVTDQLLVVCEVRPCKPLGHSLWEVAGFGRAEIVGEWDVSVVKVFKLAHYKGR